MAQECAFWGFQHKKLYLGVIPKNSPFWARIGISSLNVDVLRRITSEHIDRF